MELEINGVRADTQNSVITINRKVVDINNPEAKGIDFTNSFSLPRTERNNKIFNSAYSVGSNNVFFDRLYQAKLIDQFFLFNGSGFLKSINRDDYKFQLSEKSKSIIDDLNADLKDLDFESYDFTFNNANYDILKLESVDNIWIWPIVCMHQNRIIGNTRYTSGDAGLAYSRPMFRWKKMLESMFNQKDWTISWDNDLLDRVAISSNSDVFYVTSYQKTITQSFTPTGSFQITGLDTNDFNNGVTVTTNNIDIAGTTTKFRVRGTITTDANINLVFNSLSTSGDNEIDELFIPEGVNEVDFTTGELKTDDVNNVITIFLEGTANVDFSNVLIYTIIDESDLGDFSANNLIGYMVKAYDNLPNKKQIDIFLDSLVLTNSIIIPNSLEKKIELHTLGNINRINSVDWSSKFNQGTETIKNDFRGLGKRNNLIYDNDNTVSNELGKAVFNTDIEYLPDEVDYIMLNWGASIDTQINSFSTSAIEIYTDTIRVDKNENNKELNNRIVYFYDSAPGLYTIGRFNEIDWNNLRENYYKTWFNSLLNPRIIDGTFDLKKIDVLSFDFRKLIYISYFGSYFFNLGISNFIPNNLTKVELLRIS